MPTNIPKVTNASPTTVDKTPTATNSDNKYKNLTFC